MTLTQLFTNIANAIRGKTGSSSTMEFGQMLVRYTKKKVAHGWNKQV